MRRQQFGAVAHTTDTGDTTLGRGFAEYVAQHPPEQSGFYPVYDGIDSLALRLLIAERAERLNSTDRTEFPADVGNLSEGRMRNAAFGDRKLNRK